MRNGKKNKKMRTFSLILLLLTVAWLLPAAAGNDDDCYVKTSDHVYFGKDVKIGLLHTEIVFSDGSSLKINKHDVIAIKHHKQLFMLMPVFCERNDTVCMAMMELISAKTGYRVFMYCCPKNDDKLTDASQKVFFVYKDGKFYRRFCEDQTEALKAVGVKVI